MDESGVPFHIECLIYPECFLSLDNHKKLLEKSTNQGSVELPSSRSVLQWGKGRQDVTGLEKPGVV